MRLLPFALFSSLVAACECGDSSRAPSPVTTEDEAEPAAETLAHDVPTTGRTDLPAATPTVEVIASARGYRVSNRALVATWPAAERARARAAAPPDMAEFPVIEVAVPTIDPAPLLVPGLRDALARTAEADRARDPASGAPIVFSLRAAPDVRWDRVLRAIYGAALVGYSEPWLVVRDHDGSERVLRLAGEVNGGVPSAGSREAIAAAFATLGAAPTEALEVPADPGAVVDEALAMGSVRLVTLALRLEEHGLRVRRGVVELAGDCHTPSADGSPAFTTATLDRARLTICLGTVGAFERATFEVDPDIAYGSAVLVLEVLHSMERPVSLVAAEGPP